MFVCIHSPEIPVIEMQAHPAERGALAEFAYAFSPFVEEVSTDTVVIDVEGSDLRFGSQYELANQIAILARSGDPGGWGCCVNVALAANPDTAIHAAKFCRGVTFTAPGEELTSLGSLPLTALQFSLVGLEEKGAIEILETLSLWGVHTFQQFADLPTVGVSARLGQDGVKLQQLASGRTSRHLKLPLSVPTFSSSLELDYPIAELEPLSFILARLLNQICASLNAYALATNALHVEMKLEKGVAHELKLNLPYPMRDHKVFLKLLQMDTEMHPPASAVVAVSINCEPVKPRLLQTGLFIPLAPEPEKLELTLARLARLVGPTNIGSPELLNTHRPDAFRVNRFKLKESKKRRSNQRSAISNQQSAISKRQAAIGNRQSLGFRMFRPPLPALVQAERGCPREISAWDRHRSVYGKVVGVAGPWRSSGDWWHPDGWARDEWDIGVESNSKVKTRGGNSGRSVQVLYRVYREVRNGAWFIEGVYD